eukprot:Partr_v1_DN27531_c0_g1_i4_m30544 putative WD repeat domain 78
MDALTASLPPLAPQDHKRASTTMKHNAAATRTAATSTRRAGAVAGLVPQTTMATNRHRFQILDDQGRDVTPRSLISNKSSTTAGPLVITGLQQQHQSSRQRASRSETAGLSFNSAAGTEAEKKRRALLSRGTANSAVSSVSSTIQGDNDYNYYQVSTDQDLNNLAEAVTTTTGQDTTGSLTLKETPTICLLDIASKSVSTTSAEYGAVRARNDTYARLLKTASADSSTHTSTQTPVLVYKHAQVQASIPRRVNASTQDPHADEGSSLHSTLTTATVEQPPPRPQDKRESNASTIDGSTTTTASHPPINAAPQAPIQSSTTATASKSLAHFSDRLAINAPALLSLIKRVESIAVSNISLPKVLHFHQHNNTSTSTGDDDAVASVGTGLSLLWSFKTDVCRGRTAALITWHRRHPDIFAVSYAPSQTTTSTSSSGGGVVAVWSTKNPEVPVTVYRVPLHVSSLAFSCRDGYLAMGCTDGSIRMYLGVDMVWTSALKAVAHHTDAVTRLQWMTNEEILVSTSLDGRVIEWKLDSGMESVEVMTLRRPVSSSGGSHVVSALHSAVDLDVDPVDPSRYLVATQEGCIHLCSRNSPEKYVLSIEDAHSGPVHRVAWSRDGGLFLSAGADWMIRVWTRHGELVREFQPAGHVCANDIAWSSSSNDTPMFAAVSDDGKIEVWRVVADGGGAGPVAVHTVLDHRLTAVSFARGDGCLLTGDNNGSIAVYSCRWP